MIIFVQYDTVSEPINKKNMMTKEDVQQRVSLDYIPLELDQFQWDSELKIFQSNVNGLYIDFTGIDICTFHAGSDCYFRTGSHCVFNAGNDCSFHTRDFCGFRAGIDCIYDVGEHCYHM